MKAAIFLDKDGTLIPDIPYNVNPDLITLSPGVAEGLHMLQQHGFLLIVTTNQAGIAKGMFAETAIEPVIEKLGFLLGNQGVKLDGFYYCPHYPEGTVKKYRLACDCRKPLPGLIYRAAKDHNIDLKKSWMIGDILHDVEAGNRAGCKSILVNNGNETEWEINKWRIPAFEASNIKQSADYILSSVHE